MTNDLIKESERAMASVHSVLAFNKVDHDGMSLDQMIDAARKFSAPCAHKWDRPYRGHGTRHCVRCGGLQDN